MQTVIARTPYPREISYPPLRRLYAVAIACILLLSVACALLLIRPNTSSAQSAQNTNTAPYAGAGCTIPNWSQDNAPSRNGTVTLSDVTVVSPTDVWAVGNYLTTDYAGRAEIDHWNGTTWTPITPPAINTVCGYSLSGISAVSASDIWVIGHAGDGTVTLHWNGSTWTRLPSPTDLSIVLEDIDAISANDVWVVGFRYDSGLFTMHWNGTAWTEVAAPNNGTQNELHSVSGSASNDVWAVGEAQSNLAHAIHWDGTVWTAVTLPQVGPGGDTLFGVATISPTDAWAVGRIQYGGSLILHWNGTAWADASTASVPGILYDVAASSANNVWGVGITNVQIPDALIARWNGSTWESMILPTPYNSDSRPAAVSALPTGQAWAVGSTSPGYYTQAFIAHTDGQTCASPTPSVTATATPVSTPLACENYSLDFMPDVPIVPGTSLVAGSQCDNCVATIQLPFPYTLYNTTYNSVVAGSNGILDFTGTSNDPFNECFPDPQTGASIAAFWDDLSTSTEVSPTLGIFTSVSGEAPNRIFNIEWRAVKMLNCDPMGYKNFEVKLYEGYKRFDIVMGEQEIEEASASMGVQQGGGSSNSTVVTCSLVSSPPGNTQIFTLHSFTDVPSNSTFDPFVTCLSCKGIVNGYPCGSPGEPCTTANDPYFRPNNAITRGQLAKIVSLAAGFDEQVSGQSFEDIPPGTTFYQYIERLYSRSVMQGYPCGGPGEPCEIGNLPYFRPNSNSTRGQVTKIISNAAGFSDPVAGQTFEDVPPASTFYTFTQRLLQNRPGVMNGYACGGPGEPCVAPNNRPYFRPGSTLTRGQNSKIVANTFFPNCEP